MKPLDYDPGVPMAGAKSSKGGSGSTGAVEAPNTLQSKTTIKLLEILGEGPINRLVAPDGQPGQAVILGAGTSTATPLQSADGTFNYQGATVDFRLGEPSQDPMGGFDDQVTTVQVSVPVTNQGDPIAHAVVRRVNDLDTAAVRVVMQVDALVSVDTSNGNQNGYSVEYCIDVKASATTVGSQFVEKVHDRITGKTISAWQQAYRIPLDGSGPWDIRVRRISPDDTSTSKQSPTSWALLEQITEYPLGYPYTAYVGLTADTSQFGTSIPVRGYLVEGLIVSIPSNYDPVARTYTGIWDGTFTSGYTNNPAWVLYDVLSNNRYGLGDLFTTERLSLTKWDLYQIAKYADAFNARQVGNGAGQTNDYGVNGLHGVPDLKGGFEPRFTFNGVINTKEKAYECIAAICGMMRAAMFWAGGQARLMQDRPTATSKIFTPANAIDGMFNYTGTALRARHTAVRVLWCNPDKGWDTDDVVIEDPDAIQRYGYNLKEETAFGCTSVGQATRHASNILVTERLETDSVQWNIGSGEIDMLPGQVCDIADPAMTQAEWGGRVALHTTNTVTFDRQIQFDAARTYTLTVVLADGTLFDVGITNPGGPATTVQLTSSFDAGNQPVPNAMYAISSDVLSLRSFRLVSIGVNGDGTFKMAALQYADGKFAEIESGLKQAPQMYSDLPATNQVVAPSNLTLNYSAVVSGNSIDGVLEIDWQASTDVYLMGYYVEYQYGFDDWVRLPLQKNSNARLINPKLGPVRVRVTAVNMGGIASEAITNSVDLSTGTVSNKALVTNLVTIDGGTTWSGIDLNFQWVAQSAYSNAALLTDGSDPFFKNFRVNVYTAAGSLLGTYYSTQSKFTLPYDQMSKMGLARTYKIGVSVQDVGGAFSVELQATFTNPPPALISPTISQTINGVQLSFPQSSDPDFVGYLVWMSATSGFSMNNTTLVWSQSGNPMLLIPPNGTRYVRYALYDAFGTIGLNTSSEIVVTTASVNIDITDVTPPGVPTGLALSSATQTDPITGNVTVRLTATVNAQSESDLSGYSFAIAQTSGAYVEYQTAQPSFQWVVQANTLYHVKVRSFDKSRNFSGYCSTVDATTVKDTTPPGPVTGLSATASFRSAFLSWVNPADADVAAVQLWAGTNSTFANANVITSVNASANSVGGFTHTGLTSGQTLYYWAAAVDTSGNVSTVVGPVSATSISLTGSDGGGIPTVSSLPGSSTEGSYAYLSTDKQLYVWKNGAWARAVSAGDLSGQIVTSQIAAGAIQAAQIGAGQITAVAIAAGSITSDRIQAGTILGDRINSTTSLPGTITVGSTGFTLSTIQSDTAAGTPGGNRVPYSLMENGLNSCDYTVGSGTNGSASVGLSAGLNYFNVGFSAIGPGNYALIQSKYFTVTAGERLSYQIALGGFGTMGNGTQRVSLLFLAADGSGLGLEANTFAGNANGVNYPTAVGGFATVPAGAALATLRLVLDVGVSSTCNPGLTFAQPMVATASVGQTVLPAFAPSGIIPDPASVVNANTTLITSGKIQLQGGTTLSSWQNGGDTTKIEGGNIAANTIKANSITIGNRNVSVVGCNFQISGGVLSWSAGYVLWTGDDGVPQASPISAGSTSWLGGGFNYVFWTKGATSFTTGSDNWQTAQVNGSNTIIMCTWAGSVNFVANYGGTIVNGANITTGTITATQIAAATITATQIAAYTITGDRIAANTISADRIVANSITSTQIAAGSISGDRLTIGQGNNLLYGAGHILPPSNMYNVYDTTGQMDLYGRPWPDPNYSLSDGSTCYTHQNGTNNTYTQFFFKKPLANGTYTEYYDVQGSQNYEFSFYAVNHRSTSYIQVIWYDGNKTQISYVNGATLGPENSAASVIGNYGRRGLIAAAPSNAAFVRINIVKNGTQAGQSDSYMFWTRPMFAQATPYQTELSPWSAGSGTYIDGNGIITNTINASSIVAGSITASQITVGGIDVGRLAANAATGAYWAQQSTENGTPAGAQVSITINPIDIPVGQSTVGVRIIGSQDTLYSTYYDLGYMNGAQDWGSTTTTQTLYNPRTGEEYDVTVGGWTTTGNLLAAQPPSGGVWSFTSFVQLGAGSYTFAMYNHGNSTGGGTNVRHQSISVEVLKR